MIESVVLPPVTVERIMSAFPTAIPSPKVIDRPSCPKCGTKMMLRRIEPDAPDHDKRTFECPSCNHEETFVFKYK